MAEENASKVCEIHPMNPAPAPSGPQPPQQAGDWTVPKNPREDPRHVDNQIARIKELYPGLTDEQIDEMMM